LIEGIEIIIVLKIWDQEFLRNSIGSYCRQCAFESITGRYKISSFAVLFSTIAYQYHNAIVIFLLAANTPVMADLSCKLICLVATHCLNGKNQYLV
jgi:hypothetical protein